MSATGEASPGTVSTGRPPGVASLVIDAAGLIPRMAAGNLTIAVAESCTGGLLGARFTDIPGASAVFRGGVIAYHDAVKIEQLEVPAELLRDGHGAVSAAVAEAMARGVRQRLHSDIAVAVSGIAGPYGGSKEKPIGTVWLAAVGPGKILSVHRIQATGDRLAVREQAVREAFILVGRNLQEWERELATA